VKENTIKFPRGNTAYIRLKPTLNGEPYTLAGTDEIRLTVKKKLSERVVIEKCLTAENGELIITFMPSDTAHLPHGYYRYDCAVNLDGGFYTFIQQSDFILTSTVTEPFGECGNASEINIGGSIDKPQIVTEHCGCAAMSPQEVTQIFNNLFGGN
jgi:hypothetical protein